MKILDEVMRRESCCVADYDCENPAGWGSSYGFAINNRLNKIPVCASCGYAVCKKCSDFVEYYGEIKRLCNNCIRELSK